MSVRLNGIKLCSWCLPRLTFRRHSQPLFKNLLKINIYHILNHGPITSIQTPESRQCRVEASYRDGSTHSPQSNWRPCTIPFNDEGLLRSTGLYTRHPDHCEGTFVSSHCGGFINAPGIWNSEQIEAWRAITDEVHSRGSFIYCQLFAMGRVADAEASREEGNRS